MTQEKAEEGCKRTWDYWVFAIAALILGAISAYNIFVPLGPGPHLSVATSYGPFLIPKAFADAVSELHKPKVDSAVEQVDTPDDPDAVRITVVMPNIFKPDTDGKTIMDELASLRGMIVLSVKNNGDRAAEKLSLQTDYSGYYVIERINGDELSGSFTRRFDIGSLAQDEVLKVPLSARSLLAADPPKSF